MPKLIKNQQLTDNPYITLAKDSALDEALASSSSHILVPVQLWLDNQSAFAQSGKTIGVWFDSDQNATLDGALAHDALAGVDVVALNFPTFMDGRSYSTAVVLRQQCQYEGELRAIGQILRDQLFFLKRCGFDSFDVCDEVKLEDALSAFSDFTDSYQGTVEVPEPLFIRHSR